MREPVRFHWLIWLGSGAALLVLLLPVVIVVMAGLTAGEYLTFPPQGLSLRWVVGFLQSPTFFPAYLFSLELALITMVISSVMGTMAASLFDPVAGQSHSGDARPFPVADRSAWFGSGIGVVRLLRSRPISDWRGHSAAC